MTSKRSTPVRLPIPATRGPFVNTPLLSVPGGAGQPERFWISTWNTNLGAMGVLLDESGQARIYRFPLPHYGFYSAVAQDRDTLWLCGDVSRVVRLDLPTGRFDVYETGAPSALVFQGLAIDRRTGKLFAAAHPPPKTVGFSFDYRRRRPVKVYADMGPGRYMRFSFPNGDGSHSIVMHTPHTLMRWNPADETVDPRALPEPADAHAPGTTYRLIDDGAGRWYFPQVGWYDPARRRFVRGPEPAQPMTWFARRGSLAWGYDSRGESLVVGLWDLAGSAVRELCAIPDVNMGVALSQSGKILAVSHYGEFLRYDGRTGQFELARRLKTDSIGRTDCLCRIDRDRLLGTPFISQRFWEIHLPSGRGTDCGRAAPGTGEILDALKVGRKIYLAAYHGGELMEYDPRQHPHFPENPRVVADPPGGMRPVASADDGRNIYYSCSAHYGHLGSVLTRYDTRTGRTLYRSNPLGPLQVQGLWYDRTTGLLVGCAVPHADCDSAPPAQSPAVFACFDPKTLKPLRSAPAPAGARWPRIIGPIGRGRYLCSFRGEDRAHVRWFVLDAARLRVPDWEQTQPAKAGVERTVWACRPGLFILRFGPRVELWDLRSDRRIKTLTRQFRGYEIFADRRSVYLVDRRTVTVLDA